MAEKSVYATPNDAISSGARAQVWPLIAVFALLGALISIAVEGFQFGILNNIYHIPIVLRSYNWPEFSNDPFYQSLHNFTSLVWPGLSFIATPHNVRFVFLGAHICSRFLFYVASLYFLVRSEPARIRKLALFVLVIALGRAFVGYSMIGLTGLQIDYFTHTELTFPFLLASIMLAAERRWILSLALNGIVFNISAFTGIWMAMILPLVIFFEPPERRPRFKQILIALTVEAVIAIPTALWILQTITTSRDAPAFDYVAFLRYFFPRHFLIEASRPFNILEFIMVYACGEFALRLLDPPHRTYKIVLRLLMGLFLVGVVLPYVTSSRLLLNLHLLRIDGVVIFLSLLLLIQASVKIIGETSVTNTALAVVVLASLSIGDWHLIGIVAALVLYRVAIATRSNRILTQGVLLFVASSLSLMIAFRGSDTSLSTLQLVLVAILCLALATMTDDLLLLGVGLVIASANFTILLAGAAVCLGICLWGKKNAIWYAFAISTITAIFEFRIGALDRRAAVPAILLALMPGVFLIATWIRKRSLPFNTMRVATIGVSICILLFIVSGLQQAFTFWYSALRPNVREVTWKQAQEWARMHTSQQTEFLVASDMEGFQLGSDRRVWTDWHQGAAVMWSPSFYPRWMSRYPEVNQITSHAELNRYVRAHKIAYYVLDRKKVHEDNVVFPGESRVYENQEFAIYQVEVR